MPTSKPKKLISNLGAVVLCGGKSSRLGVDKNQLIFQGQTFLQRVVTAVQEVCSPTVLVGNTDFSLHDLAESVGIASDERADKGPLEGIRVGLKELAPSVDFAFVTSCDVPLLNAELIRYLFDQRGEFQAVIPVDDRRVFGMSAIYRCDLHLSLGARIDRDELRVSELATTFATNCINVETLKSVDPQLDSLINVNSARDYFELLDRFGLDCPKDFPIPRG